MPVARKVGRMEEQSHKDEMRAAVRGYFERLRVRRPAAGRAPKPVPSPDAAVSEWRSRVESRLLARLFRRG